MMKELSLLTLQQEALTAISMGGFFLAHNYRSVNNEWDYRVEPDYEFASLKPEHYTAVAGLFDINNLKLLMGIDLSDYVNAVSRSYTDVEWADLVHATDGIVYDLPKVVGLPSKAENNALTQEDLDLLHSLREPFYAEVCEAMQARARKELESVKDVRIETTPRLPSTSCSMRLLRPTRARWCSSISGTRGAAPAGLRSKRTSRSRAGN